MHSNISVVFTIVGPDRPGIVNELAQIVARNAGNWVDSRMARLGGQFAGLVGVSIPEDNNWNFIEQLEAMRGRGFSITHTPSGPAPSADLHHETITVRGNDRPGIVREVCGALARLQVNVEEFHTTCESAAMSGEVMFQLRANIAIPSTVSVEMVKSAIEGIALDIFAEFGSQQVLDRK